MKEKIPLDLMQKQTIYAATIRGELIMEKRFAVSDTGVSSKNFHAWKLKGLLDFVDKGAWARLSLVELIWIRVLETMRKFGCSVELMRKIYSDYFTRAFDENLAEKNTKANIDYYKQQKKIRSLTDEEEQQLHQLQYLYKDKIILTALRTEISYFSQLIFECLQYKVETGIIIFEDGSFNDFVNHQDKLQPGINIINLNKPHLYIPISHYILDFLEEDEHFHFLSNVGLLDEDELRVIKEMRNKNIRTITITFNEKDHKPEKIESDKRGIITGEKAKEIMRILGLKNYMGIELNTRDGKTLSFKQTEKKFI